MPLEAAEESIREHQRGVHRWRHMLEALAKRLHELDPGTPEDHPWRRYFEEFTEVSERHESDDVEVKRVVVRGYMMLLFEQDPENQAKALRPEIDRPVMFRSPKDIERAVAEREE